MLRTLSLLLTGTTLCAIGMLSANAQEAKKDERPKIPGGIEAHVKSVDTEKETVTVVTDSGAVRTYNVTEDTTMLGPRGGKVRRRLHDRRFHEGMPLTVVVRGSTLEELHFGFTPRQPEHEKGSGKTAKSTASSAGKSGEKAAIAPPEKKGEAKKTARESEHAAYEEDEEDNEIPGTVKSYDEAHRLLVVSLINGSSRSFFLARDLKVLVRGAASKQGIADPALKEGAHVTVLVEEGGRRVKELHVNPAPPARGTKKAA
jgi:hypothetical protein